MALLFAALSLRRKESEDLTVAAEGLAKHLSLLFVPAGVGVMMYVTQVADEWLPIVCALFASTVLAIAATALTFAWLAQRQERMQPEDRQ
jgi:holin-like protein